ncbi:MAG: carbohydrate ABC transporter permease [Planctomycetota bacterium]
MAEKDNISGYGGKVGAANTAVTGALHVVLLAIGSLFLLPFIWMLSTSLKPLDQTMTLPPTWIPRAAYATLEGQRAIVIKEKKLAEDHVIVIQHGGHDAGKRKLLAASAVKDGKAQVRFTRAGHEEYEPEPVPVEIVKHCPKDYWHVSEWTPEYSGGREKSQAEPRWDCVPEEDLSSAPHPFWSNYRSALSRMRQKGDDPAWYAAGFPHYLLNTLWVCVLSLLGAVVSCTLVAYSFAFLEFRGRELLFGTTLAIMMVPFPAVMVPLFDVFRSLGWVGTFKPLWVPLWFGGAFYIFLLRQFFLGLPKDLLDAARIDGCSELEILWHVVVPLARPALAMVALFQFLGSWKDFMGPMLYLTDRSQFTLSLGLQAFQSQHGGTPWHLSMAASMMFSLPLLILFLLARKTFMRGIAMTGIKG